jgi:hypothetical protein
MRHTVVGHYYTVPKFADVEGRGVGGCPGDEKLHCVSVLLDSDVMIHPKVNNLRRGGVLSSQSLLQIPLAGNFYVAEILGLSSVSYTFLRNNTC